MRIQLLPWCHCLFLSCCLTCVESFASFQPFRISSSKRPSSNYYDQRMTTSTTNSFLSSSSITQQHSENPHHNNPTTTSTTKLFDLKLVLVDHYDSYTYNLYNMLTLLCQTPPVVLTKNDILSEQEWTAFDGIISSPGPGRPPHDVSSTVMEILQKHSSYEDIPLLGVCLGHQALGYSHGYPIDLAPCGPVHGQVSTVHQVEEDTKQQSQQQHQQSFKYPSLFQNIPLEFQVVRYHSLVVNMKTTTTTDPNDTTTNNNNNSNHNNNMEKGQLVPTAYCYDEDNNHAQSSSTNSTTIPIVMAVQHTHRPQYGVQFHPESVSTQYGMELMTNFCHICQHYKQQQNTRNSGDEKQQLSQENDVSVQLNSDNDTNLGTNKNNNDVNTIIHNNDKEQHPPTKNTNKKDDSGGQHQHHHPPSSSPYQVMIHKIDNPHNNHNQSSPTPEKVYELLYGSTTTTPYSFWLDSSNGELVQDNIQSRFSIMGGGGVEVNNDDENHNGKDNQQQLHERPLFHRLEYYGQEHSVKQQGLYMYSSSNETNPSRVHTTTHNNTILQYLKDQCQSSTKDVTFVVKNPGTPNGGEQLSILHKGDKAQGPELPPFHYRGGYVGYLGYEVRYDSQQFLEDMDQRSHPPGDDTPPRQNRNHRHHPDKPTTQEGDPNVPSAAFVFADQSLVYDHWTQHWYLVGLSDHSPKGQDEVLKWMNQVERDIQSMMTRSPSPTTTTSTTSTTTTTTTTAPSTSKQNPNKEHRPLQFVPSRVREQYQQDIGTCHEYIRQGESYELCLTNQFEAMIPTTTLSRKNQDPFGLYKVLRQRNPAPFSAFLNFNAANPNNNNKSSSTNHKKDGSSSPSSASVAICCSSPERFISIKPLQQATTTNNNNNNNNDDDDDDDDGDDLRTTKLERILYQVESKPIKGTVARYQHNDDNNNNSDDSIQKIMQERDYELALELQQDVKNRAENLMIVDLLRNDLHRVCEPGSVHVPKLMDIESFATVHQMVSTIRGTLGAPNNSSQPKNAMDALIACFPGGSMTGAPKVRTTELLHGLEQGRNRGPYSGCLGYISVDGSMDMNIVIRTAVVTPSTNTNVDDEATDDNSKEEEKGSPGWKVSIGGGGAITYLSDSEDEYEEMLLKTRAVVESVQTWYTERSASDDDNGENGMAQLEQRIHPSSSSPI